MKRVFNLFIQIFDAIQDLKTLTGQDPVETYNDLPTKDNNENGDRFAKDTDILCAWISSNSFVGKYIEAGGDDLFLNLDCKIPFEVTEITEECQT